MENLLDLWKIPNHLDKKLKEYPNKIVTRMPPEPSFCLHIGHAKAAFINYVIARKYHGKLIIRMDDTNPNNESIEYEDAILEDLKRINIEYDLLSHTSDYFAQIQDYAEYLIKNDLAYVDNLDQDTISSNREKCIESPNRNISVENNLILWDEMKNSTRKDSCVRIKINMRHSNSTCRDPSIIRHIDTPHYRTKNQFKLYPTYDFACPIVDSLEGVTHVFRSTEFSDRDLQYNIILDNLKLRKPLLFSYGKVNIEGSVLSKRKIKELIQKRQISNWDDPRLLTIRGVFNKGLHINALYDFISELGFSKSTVNMTEETLWNINRKHIDKLSTRYTVLSKDNAVSYNVRDKIDEMIVTIPKFVKNNALGKRLVYYSNNILIDERQIFKNYEEITLMNWGNAFIDSDNIMISLHLDGDFKLTEKKVLWVDDTNNVDVIITTYHGIFNDPTVEEYYGEYDMLNLKKGDYVQLLRMNYYICRNVDVINKIVRLIEVC
jgi:glutamyl-tRNA synthetase